jgi:hypothetical protein
MLKEASNTNSIRVSGFTIGFVCADEEKEKTNNKKQEIDNFKITDLIPDLNL